MSWSSADKAASENMYRSVEAFLIVRGWRRIEPDEGWWWHPERESDVTIGGALDAELDAQHIDTRVNHPASVAASPSAGGEA